MAKKRKSTSSGTELKVFHGRAGRANAAIFEVLATEYPLTIKELLKKINEYEGLEETYYASLSKRLRSLRENGLILETKPARRGDQASYQICIKAVLDMFLKENSMQDITSKATNTQAAHILLTLLNVVRPERN